MGNKEKRNAKEAKKEKLPLLLLFYCAMQKIRPLL